MDIGAAPIGAYIANLIVVWHTIFINTHNTIEGDNSQFRLEDWLLDRPVHAQEPIVGWDPSGKHKVTEANNEFSRHVLSEYQNDPSLKQVLAAIHGKIVIDLGSAAYMSIPKICQELGARAYVGVDLYNPGAGAGSPDPRRSIVEPTNKRIRRHCPDLAYAQVHADLFDFLRYVPTDSVSISICGMDSATLDDRVFGRLLREIERVCEPGGLVFGSGTEFLYQLKWNPRFTDLRPNATRDLGTEVYHKQAVATPDCTPLQHSTAQQVKSALS